jgi:hypothetical protein
LHQLCNLWFRPQVAIAKDLSKQRKTRDYRHGEPDFAMKGMYQTSIRVTVFDWLKVSLNTVQCKSINFMRKYVIKFNVKPNTIMELWAWPVFKPHISDFCLLLLMAGVLEGIKDELDNKSFLANLMRAKPCCNESHERSIRRREGKSIGCRREIGHRLSPMYYTSIAEINSFRYRQD